MTAPYSLTRVRYNTSNKALQCAVAHVDELGVEPPHLLLLRERWHNEVRQRGAQLRAQPEEVVEATENGVRARVNARGALSKLQGAAQGGRDVRGCGVELLTVVDTL